MCSVGGLRGSALAWVLLGSEWCDSWCCLLSILFEGAWHGGQFLEQACHLLWLWHSWLGRVCAPLHGTGRGVVALAPDVEVKAFFWWEPEVLLCLCQREVCYVEDFSSALLKAGDARVLLNGGKESDQVFVGSWVVQ